MARVISAANSNMLLPTIVLALAQPPFIKPNRLKGFHIHNHDMELDVSRYDIWVSTSAAGSHRHFLNVTGACNRAWAAANGYGYEATVDFHELTVSMCDLHNFDPSNKESVFAGASLATYSAYNRVGSLLDAIAAYARYGSPRLFLYVDADVMIAQRHIIDDMRASNPEALLWAVSGGSQDFNINDGMFLWNLTHPLSPHTARAWRDMAIQTRCDPYPCRGLDQCDLHNALKLANVTKISALVSKIDSSYSFGPKIVHAARNVAQHGALDWNASNGLAIRMKMLEDVKHSLKWCQP